MASNSSPISSIDLPLESREVPDRVRDVESDIDGFSCDDAQIETNSPATSRINYSASTTAPIFNYAPVRPYPPINRVGMVDAHDLPYFLHGRKNKETIARENQFDLEGNTTRSRRRTKNPRKNAQSFAITCWTDMNKEKLIDDILNEFSHNNVQYICVAREVGSAQGKTHLHVQIVLRKAVNKTSWFLDKYTGVHCNYQVTMNNVSWNEYVKKDGDFVEYGEFQPTGTHASQDWSQPSPRTAIDDSNLTPGSPSLPPAKRVSVRVQAEARRQRKDTIAETALIIAKKSINSAMNYTRKELPYEFMHRSDNFQRSFVYVYKQAQERYPRIEDKEFVWDLSFPNCSPQLHAAVTEWYTNHFRNPHRPKCFVIIGGTGTGKTSFALSLPGITCYFKGRWNLDTWSDKARYLVFDDIPWDEFDNRNFPNKKDLLTTNGPVAVSDKYKPTVTINVTMPSIILLNPGDEGSLVAPPLTRKAQHVADYWSQRACVYIMSADEYFYKPPAPLATTTSGAAVSNQTRPLLGYPDELADAQRQWLQRQQRHRAATTTSEPIDEPLSTHSASLSDVSAQGEF